MMNKDTGNLIQEAKEALDGSGIQEQREATLAGLKIEANNFLWINLPPWVTIGEAEKMACDITASIQDLWLRPPKEEK